MLEKSDIKKSERFVALQAAKYSFLLFLPFLIINVTRIILISQKIVEGTCLQIFESFYQSSFIYWYLHFFIWIITYSSFSFYYILKQRRFLQSPSPKSYILWTLLFLFIVPIVLFVIGYLVSWILILACGFIFVER